MCHEPVFRTQRPWSGVFGRRSIRVLALGLWLALTIAAAVAGALGFRIDNSVSIWFETDDPALTDYRAYMDDFGSREWMLAALSRPGSESGVADAERTELVSRLNALEHVHDVLSAADFPPASRLVNDFLRPDPSSPDEALLLLVTNDIETQDGYREELLDEIREAGAGLGTVDRIHLAGIAVINGELNKSARRDMLLFLPLVTVLLAVIGALLFRNVRDTAVLLAISFGTVVVTQGLLIGLGNSLNMITIMLPTILIALSVADSIHLIHAFHTARGASGDSYPAAEAAVREIAWPCAGTTLTTISGFLAFAGSSVVPVFQLAVFASLGIAFAWLLTVTAGPILLAVLWGKRARTQPPAVTTTTRLLGAWWAIVAPNRAWVVAAFAFSAISLLGLRSLEADTDYVKFFRDDSRVPRDYQTIEEGGFPQNPLSLVFTAPVEEAVLSPPYWSALAEFVVELEDLPGVHSVLSPFLEGGPTNATPDERPADHNEAGERGARLPDRFGLFDGDQKQTQFIVMTAYPSSRRLNDLLARIDPLVEELLPPGLTMTPTGTSLLWAHMDDGVIRSQKESLLIVCVVCFAILVLLFRSPSLAAIGLAVSLFPVGIVLGLMGLWGIPVNMATVLIAGIAVGLAVDDTIHFLHAFQAARRSGVSRGPASARALADVGLRIVMTSLILVGAFGVMGLSDFMPTSQFGLLSSLTILLALVADLALLPVALGGRTEH